MLLSNNYYNIIIQVGECQKGFHTRSNILRTCSFRSASADIIKKNNIFTIYKLIPLICITILTDTFTIR